MSNTLRGRPLSLFAVLSWQARELGGRLDSVPTPVPRQSRTGRPSATIVYKPRGWVTCAICYEPIELKKTAEWDGDHIEPKANGGCDASMNFRVTHVWCNRRRGDLPAELDRVASLP